MRCPHCHCRDIGKIGANQYYCWGCFKEFNVSGDDIKVYEVAEDGSLVAVEYSPDSLELGTGTV
ncbi:MULTISPECIES: hypothetical protein [Alicyclobacillus]|jgi:hypothetical protein|uniref:Uncharacterized protein n=1 Tax=Alicyclobacillus macrosporangiidus TaxID=392015 RepID=A0A1I7K9S7_9BACL|nr:MULTISPECIES: hypothetical protein [Alicyclobacillus]MCL6515958.1 hypothetical protein [Alicyclobacillus sp.]SFU94169.1 hypothetical protein SAMN05421543_11497 [Alicyclobacillus macrosporangiidus]